METVKEFHTLHFKLKHVEGTLYNVYMHNIRLCTLDVEDRVLRFVDDTSVPLTFMRELAEAADHLMQFIDID